MRLARPVCWLSLCLLLVTSTFAADERPNLLVADFDGADYGSWKVTGDAFGPGPARGTLPRRPNEPTVKLHIFLDRSLVEVYADDGRICVSRVFAPAANATGIEFFTENGSENLRCLDVWPIKTIW